VRVRVCVCVCVCVEHLADLHHAQHGGQNGLHSYDGRVIHTLSHVFDPQECV
jgi:hypothetical protein